MRRRRPSVDKAKKTAYVLAALFPDRLPIDAAEIIASRVMEIDGSVVALIRRRMGGGKLGRDMVRAALDEAARKRV